MSDVVEKHNILEKRITEAQRRLYEIDSENPLLELVDVDPMGIKWGAEFGGRYKGIPAHNALNKYASELEESAKKQT